jgi:hypothetical protein
MRKVGPTFHKRVFAEKPVSKFTVSVSCDIYKAVPGKECYVHGLDETGIITKIRIETVLNLQ